MASPQRARTFRSMRSLDTSTMSFHSNSIIAQCNAAVSGLGIVLLPTFVAAGVAGLVRILPDIVVRREIWVSIRTEQSHLARNKSVLRFMKYIFKRDADFLSGLTENLASQSKS